jgi:transposase
MIFSSSKHNPILETGYNREHFILTKANIVVAFSHNRFIPVFLRVVPGSIHEITTVYILLEELGKGVILVFDKGLNSADVRRKLFKMVTFITPLKRNSTLINYDVKPTSFFVYRKWSIKYTSYRHGRFFIYLYEDIALRAEEEKAYLLLLSKGKKVKFKEKWAGKIAIISNGKFSPKEVYETWKSGDQIEKSFDVLQNMLDVDRPYVRKEETFCGYIFASFIALIAYYLILSVLKKVKINRKVSVADTLLELSKVYKIELGKKGDAVGKEQTCQKTHGKSRNKKT